MTMRTTGGEPRAVVVLVMGGCELRQAWDGSDCRCDLELIDALLRLRLAADRLGVPLRVSHLADDLRELTDLVGVTELLCGLEYAP